MCQYCVCTALHCTSVWPIQQRPNQIDQTCVCFCFNCWTVFFFFKSVLYQLFWPFWILRFTQNQNNNVKVNLHTQLKSQHTHIKEILTNKPCSLAGWLTIFAKCCEQYDDRLRRLGLGWRRRLVHHRGVQPPVLLHINSKWPFCFFVCLNVRIKS